jgi:hypothetical protein
VYPVHVRRAGVYAAALLSIVGPVFFDASAADPMTSQRIGVTQSIVDEYGHPLRGTDPAADLFGHLVEEGALVQVLHALDGQIHPPGVDGAPHHNNATLMTTRIGLGVSPTLSTPARFGALVAPRPGGSSFIFVRVFNQPKLADASFYGDSQLFQVSSAKNPVFLAAITATRTPLDPNDDDGDGLNNSWEKSLGTDPHNPDTDGDGVSDGDERLAGMDALDAESVFQIFNLQPIHGADALLRWSSSPGMTYRVESALAPLDQNPEFTTVTHVTAAGVVTEVVIEGGLAEQGRSFRVWAVEP